jgi:hypothetical protein
MGWLASVPLDSLSERKVVEDGVILRLTGLLRSNGGWLKLLKPYNGEIDEESQDDVMSIVQGNNPAILVSTSTGRYDEQSITARGISHVLTVDILCVSSTMSGPAERTRGYVDTGPDAVVDAGDPGIYFMLASVRAALMGRWLGIEAAGTLRPVSELMLYTTANHTAWRAIYRVPVRINARPEGDADADPFDELEHRHFNRDEIEERDTLVVVGIASASSE